MADGDSIFRFALFQRDYAVTRARRSLVSTSNCCWKSYAANGTTGALYSISFFLSFSKGRITHVVRVVVSQKRSRERKERMVFVGCTGA